MGNAFTLRLALTVLFLGGCGSSVSPPKTTAIKAERPVLPVGTGKVTSGGPDVLTVTIAVKRSLSEQKATDVSFNLRQIPAGTIVMTNERGQDVEHAVKPFWMAEFETRWDEYNIFWASLDLTELHERRTEIPYLPPFATFAEGKSGSGYPADCIHFLAAKQYCKWLSALTGKRFRLPTEAEWEYACRAGGPPVRLDDKALREVAWFKGNAAEPRHHVGQNAASGNEDDGAPHPVGQKRPNTWGLYDMLGNVGEYVVRDPEDQKGLLAGGSYEDDAKDVHCGAREPYSKDWQGADPQVPPSSYWLFWGFHHAGFRVVMEE
jgi:formylglycine-generating enzyme required for sulfatase activity